MSKVAKLHKAKKAKNDEFYTLYEDVEKELSNYVDYNPDVFKDKVILCPCDDPIESAFLKVFCCYFSQWGIKKLICTSYNKGRMGKKLVLHRDVDLNGDGKIDQDDLVIEPCDGDFRREDVTKLRDECDVIVTNPPFSLFREFFKWCLDSKKQFLVIAGLDTITSSSIFTAVRDNKAWVGTGVNMDFDTPVINESGEKVLERTNIHSYWLTNLPYDRAKKPLQLLTMQECKYIYGHEKKFKDAYIKYDNIDAIEVPLVKAIPSDYKGLMAVPITFVLHHNPDQFEIVGLTSSRKDLPEMKANSKEFIDTLSKQKQKNIKHGAKIPGYFRKDGTVKCPFARIIVRPLNKSSYI